MISRKRILGRLSLLLCGLIVGLIAAELVMRVGAVNVQLAPNQLWRPWTHQGPDWSKRKREYNHQYSYHPLLGYVRRSVLEELKRETQDDQRLRILILGDSISEQGTYINRFDNLLIKRFPEHDIKVINAGITSYDTTLERRLLEHFGIKIKPHLIILQLCLNDFLSTPLITLDQDGQWTAFNSQGFDRWINVSLFQNSHLYRFLAVRLLSSIKRETPSSQDDRVRRELQRISILARQHKIPLRLILFPYFVRDLENFPRLKRFRIIIEQLGLKNQTLDLTAAYKTIPYQRLQRDAGDFVHPSPPGDKIAARELMAFSKPLIARLLKGRPKAIHRSIFPADFLKHDPPRGFETTGLDRIESLNQTTWRWALGPRMTIQFHSPGPRTLTLSYTLKSPLSDQRLDLSINGKIVQRIGPLEAQKAVHQKIPLVVQKGPNEVTLEFDRWNGPKHTFAPSDSRPMAVDLRELRIMPDSALMP